MSSNNGQFGLSGGGAYLSGCGWVATHEVLK